MFYFRKKIIVSLFFFIFFMLFMHSMSVAKLKFLFSFPTQKVLNAKDHVSAKGRTLCFNSKEQLYVVIPEAREIWVFDIKGNFITSFGDARFIEPSGIAIDHNDTIYISDLGTDTIFIFSEHGEFQSQFPLIATEESTKKPCAPFITYSKIDKRLYIADSCGHQISIYSTDGKLIESFGRMGGALGEFSGPANVAFDSQGNIYVVDPGNFRVQSLTSEYKPRFAFGESGVREGRFIRPYGIAIGKYDSIIVSDFVKTDIQIFDGTGSFLDSLGKGTVYGSVFKQPLGIAASKENKLYIVDGEQRRIYVFEIY